MSEPTPTPSPTTTLPTNPNPNPNDHDDDADSSLGDSFDDDLSSTASINSSILAHRHENGRHYHAYKDGKYLSPNDDSEQERLDLQHHLFMLTFSKKLHLCPLPEKLHRVLDVGTGTGIWAIDFADEHPETEVLGVDLSPIQPTFVPPNVSFQVDDLEEEWTFKEDQRFDFIFARMMTASFADWPRFFEQSFKHMSPGGYIELADICFPVEFVDGSAPADSALKKWAGLILDGTKTAGRPIDSAKMYKEELRKAGFVNIVEQKFTWPQNRWPKDKKMKELGAWSLENMAPSLEGFSMALFTRVFKWTKEEVEVFLVDVRKEMSDPQIHAHWPIYSVYAQKPST
ncbi:related to methyltransferase [Rhynchosporium agropyri]|uniref:Related to methyltransferase n=1 Tax=Rhynchosporium agropyri TaxID=914238 RepID=A0A1E1KCC5_9HELO|nr:related to methyltransferase [Rhynchosporium agropyri]